MCFVLYVGTNTPLRRREWRKEAPDLSVKDLSEREAAIRAHFTLPEVQYVGSTSGCGCDFPHATFQSGGWPGIDYMNVVGEDPDCALSNRRNREALVDLLRSIGDGTVELYGVWEGDADFPDPPKSHEEIRVERILDSNFLLKERGFYKVLVEGAKNL